MGWLVGYWPALLLWLPGTIGTILALAVVFDVITVKFGIHPAERIPKLRDPSDAFDLMRSRRACRSFQSRSLTAAHRAELFEAVRTYSQPERQLGDRPIRLEYVAAPLTVWPVIGAHEFLVAIAPAEYNRLAIIDVGRSLQKIVLQATRIGLATCWIGPGADQKSVVQHLGDRFDPSQDHVVCVCAVGYPSWYKPFLIRIMQLLQHRRLPLRQLFFADPQFKEPLNVDEEPFRAFGRCYEACQWAPSSYNSQTTRCAAITRNVGGQRRLMRFDFCATTHSRFYAAVDLGIWLGNWETGCAALNMPGHFRVLTREERQVENAPDLPQYDVSWCVAGEGGQFENRRFTPGI